jgi:hypothetical protein
MTEKREVLKYNNWRVGGVVRLAIVNVNSLFVAPVFHLAFNGVGKEK